MCDKRPPDLKVGDFVVNVGFSGEICKVEFWGQIFDSLKENPRMHAIAAFGQDYPTIVRCECFMWRMESLDDARSAYMELRRSRTYHYEFVRRTLNRFSSKYAAA